MVAKLTLSTYFVFVSGCAMFGRTLVEDDETCLGALKGNLVRMHVNNNWLALVIATRENRLCYKPPNYEFRI